jgi:hypothetical protein
MRIDHHHFLHPTRGALAILMGAPGADRAGTQRGLRCS